MDFPQHEEYDHSWDVLEVNKRRNITAKYLLMWRYLLNGKRFRKDGDDFYSESRFGELTDIEKGVSNA